MKLDEIAKRDIHQILSTLEVREIIQGDKKILSPLGGVIIIKGNKDKYEHGWSLDQIKKLLSYAILQGYNLDLDSPIELYHFFCSFCLASVHWQTTPNLLVKYINNFFKFNQDRLLSVRSLYMDYQKHIQGNQSKNTFFEKIGTYKNNQIFSLGFQHKFRKIIFPATLCLFKLTYREEQETLNKLGKVRYDVKMPTHVLFCIMSFLDMDAECYPYEQVITPNTLTSYNQPYEPEYRFFYKKDHYLPDKSVAEKVDNIIDFVNSDDPLDEDESVQYSLPSLTN